MAGPSSTTAQLSSALLAIGTGDTARAAAICADAARRDPDSLLAPHLHAALTAPVDGSVYDAPAAFQAFIDGGTNVELYRATIEALSAAHRRIGTRSLIDIGCGDGRVTAAALPGSCSTLDLVEPSADLLGQAEQRCTAPGRSVTAHLSTLAGALHDLERSRHDVAQSTFALHTIPPADRPAQLRRLRRIVDAVLIADFDVPAFADRSDAHARYAAERYETGLAEYGSDRDLVARGFLMPVLIGQFDPARPRMTFEQPIASWADELQATGFRSVEVLPLTDYWWAPARLLVAR